MPYWRDTDPDTARVYMELLRTMSYEQKIAQLRSLARRGRSLALAGLRLRHPQATPQELEVLYARLVLGPSRAEKVLSARQDSTRPD